MATSSSKRNNQKRPVPRATEGNLARKLDSSELERRLNSSGQLDFDRQYRRPQETAMERRSRQHAAARAAVRAAQKLSPGLVMCFMASAVLMVGILMCYIRLNDISRSIVDMKAQIEEEKATQAALQTRYEQAFELTAVKEAAEAAGMIQPSDSQIYYIDLPGEDQAVSYRDDEIGTVTRFIENAKKTLDEIMEYFQ